jgi:hypothetical protein
MKPFDLEKAKAGSPVCTRSGEKVRIICFDANNDQYPIIALIYIINENREVPLSFTKGGRYLGLAEDSKDLFMVGEKKEGWINLYSFLEDEECIGRVYATREEAMSKRLREDYKYIDTIKIEWEE